MDFEQERKALGGAPPDDRDAWIELHIKRDRQWFSVMRHLLESESPRLTGIVFDGPDKLQHLLWPYLDPGSQTPIPPGFEQVRESCWRYFRQLDMFIGQTMTLAGTDGTIFIVSDHGFTGSRDLVFINSWLEQRGHLAWRSDVPVSTGAEAGAEPNFYRFSDFDMMRTRAFAATPSSNGIYIPVRGVRGEDGIPAESYAQFRAQLIDELLNECRDPHSGERMVTAVTTRDTAFAGPQQEVAADLTLTLRDHGFFSVRRSRDVVVRRAEIVGTHHPDGIFIARGYGVRRGAAVPPLHLLDIAPTALYALGLRIPSDLEGRVAQEIFTPLHRATHPVRTGDETEEVPAMPMGEPTLAGSGAQAADILDRMRALGYIE
jgi:predicted AlkP superfamily phosphohydrolase/phosphomutase